MERFNTTKPMVPEKVSICWFRSLTTRRLKQMWDDEEYAVHCDEIHRAMNERGEGEYVAI